ncbi:MAG: hypothetical protein F9K28_11030 [Bacteroidetes bacterium]|nr:MAG: hypothetical protein F9K28_11030 [Bacteroidota bacterium]
MDETGTLTDTYDYTAFGEIDTQTGTTPNNYLYTGQQYDEVTGLYSLRARYYDPSDGRFLSRDTYAYHYQDPIELNRYLYAANNPTTHHDPFGLSIMFSYSKQNESSLEQSAPLHADYGVILNFNRGAYEAYGYSLYTKGIAGFLLALFLGSLLSISLLLPYAPPPNPPDANNPPGSDTPPNNWPDPNGDSDPYNPPSPNNPDVPYIPPSPDDAPNPNDSDNPPLPDDAPNPYDPPAPFNPTYPDTPPFVPPGPDTDTSTDSDNPLSSNPDYKVYPIVKTAKWGIYQWIELLS